MVSVLDTITEWLDEVVDTLYDIYGWIDEIPLVGGYLSPLFYDFYYAAWYIAYYADEFNDWCDSLFSDVEQILNDIGKIDEKIGDIIEDITKFLSWSEIETKITETWSIITETKDTIVDAALDTVIDKFEYIMDKVFKE